MTVCMMCNAGQSEGMYINEKEVIGCFGKCYNVK